MNLAEILATNTTLFVLDMHRWVGARRLKGKDLMLDASRVPPRKVASLGSKYIFDREELSWAGRLFTKARTACSSAGVRCMGGYAVPLEKAQTVLDDLNAVKEEFDATLPEFLDQYDQKLTTFLAECGEWAEILRGAVLTREEVEARYAFDFDVTHISPVRSIPKAEEQFEKRSARLGDQLMAEIAADARSAWERSFAGKGKVGQRAIHTVEHMLEKLRGLIFADLRVAPLVHQIDRCLDSLPRKGYLEGHDLAAVSGLVLTLSRLDDTLVGRIHDAATSRPEDEDELSEDVEATGLPSDPEADEEERDLAAAPVRPPQHAPAFDLFL